MDFFHGTTVAGLTELRPYASPYSNLPRPLVYLTTSRQLALHYIWDIRRCGVKMPMLDIRKDGVLVFQEMFPGALAYFYQGVSGYIYRCIGDWPINPDSGVHTCATSEEIVPIADFEYVDDVYDRIISYAETGAFVYERYEELPQWRHDRIREIVLGMIARNNLTHNPGHPLLSFVQEKFPAYWEEALRRNKES